MKKIIFILIPFCVVVVLMFFTPYSSFKKDIGGSFFVKFSEHKKTFCDQEVAQKEPITYEFEDYPVPEEEMYSGPPAPADLGKNPEAWRFKTVITNGAKKGPNFAGHYTVVTWGCGSPCQEIAIVDAKTGFVHLPSFSAPVGVEFKKDSYLLIVNPGKSIDESFPELRSQGLKTEYWRWLEGRFYNLYTN